ncbi:MULTISPECIES: hypothetical protein [unclassified Streptomyces]|uniref:hypothetical protein n=1 Tax=unclassified Streptomyces TaxID=2593676 RepID=UPI000DB9A3DA|nr:MULTISPECIES: hypothetical protein [unclassified Streptomyces]MYT68373.1 hypothetical protein [Streptomyces sp. SID8367]RAJ77010.1 hypothetical protein K377_06179 [Streptomyces sp. PsTaAH-137]
MAVDFSVEGTIELYPPVPLAQLWELIDGGDFHVAPHGIGETELTALLTREAWVLVPDPASGTDSEGRPAAIKHLRVRDPEAYSFTINHRLMALSAWLGPDHEFDGALRYQDGDVGTKGVIEPFEDGEEPEWHETAGRMW